jgi:hypothetical protein
MAYRSRRSDPSTGLTNMQGDRAAWSGRAEMLTSAVYGRPGAFQNPLKQLFEPGFVEDGNV